MAGSKYAGLKGKIPPPPVEVCRCGECADCLLRAAVAERTDASLAELTAEYNRRELRLDQIEEDRKVEARAQDACEILIQRKLDALNGDAVTMNGYTWTPTAKPRASAYDKNAMIDHFLNNGMKDLLNVHAQRLDSMIGEEALAGELRIVTVPTVDPTTGEEGTTTEVRSKIPGVRVWLQPALSRVKSSKGAK